MKTKSTAFSMPAARAITCFIIAAGYASTPVFAQNSVTVYGLVDAAIEYSNQGNGGLLKMQPGGYKGNRLGFRGTEDLGGGLSAIFNLENGFTLDTGTAAQGGRLFGRLAFVGLKDSWGTVTAGRQTSPYYHSTLAQDAFQWTMVGAIPALTRGTGNGTPGLLLNVWGSVGRVSNALVYASPNIGGFSSRLLYAFGEVEGNTSAGRFTGAGLRYASGSADLNIGYTGSRDAFDRGSMAGFSVGGSYAINSLRIFAGYLRETNNMASSATTPLPPESRIDLVNVGLRYKVRSNTTVIGQAIHVRDRSENLAVDRDAVAMAVGAEYALSKRTTLYASIGTIGNTNGSNYSLGTGTSLGGATASNARAKTASIGINHTF